MKPIEKILEERVKFLAMRRKVTTREAVMATDPIAAFSKYRTAHHVYGAWSEAKKTQGELKARGDLS